MRWIQLTFLFIPQYSSLGLSLPSTHGLDFHRNTPYLFDCCAFVLSFSNSQSNQYVDSAQRTLHPSRKVLEIEQYLDVPRLTQYSRCNRQMSRLVFRSSKT